MEDRPLWCPRCLSKFPDIRGVIYPDGNVNDGYRCMHDCHLGVGYDPNVLVLTVEDRDFLQIMSIAVD